MRTLSCAVALLLALPPGAPGGGNVKPKLWKDVPDRAEIASATFLGGKGHEWLVSGGFQPDGTVVLVGNVAGPVLELPVPVNVIGTDLPAPAEAKQVPQREKNGKQKTDKQGKPLWERPSWRHDGVTGFVVHCSSDLKKVLSAHRLPWTAGALTTAAVGKDGAIYIAGRATDGIVKLGGRVEEPAVKAPGGGKGGRCDHTFVARLTPDAARAEWVGHFRGPSDAPRLSLTPEGSVRLYAQDVRTFDAQGKLLATVSVPGGVSKTSSVSPTDGTIVTGGEHHSPTGREPWRCPTLNLHRPDGTLQYQLYDWGGPYVGLDNNRLVSDTAVRFVTHDRAGNIVLYAWSDGGNSVATREPMDVRTPVASRGLGITAAGAGVLSAAYVIRVDPKECRATDWTIWLAFNPKGRPNSVWIDNLTVGDDGSVLLSGRAAFALWQTQNRLTEAAASGEYVAVLNRELTGVRFCSVVPGAGAAEVSYDRAGWGVVWGQVNGKVKALFVGGAAGGEGDRATPTRNALQGKFGGGWCDGYAVLLDLPPAAGEEAPAVKAVPPAPGPTAASFERGASGKGRKAPAPPADETEFVFNPKVPKWATVDAEFRDHGGKLWPSFLYGRPVDGTAMVKGGRLTARFTVACTSACQPKGEQGRRVLGELLKDGEAPPLRFTLEALGEPKQVELTHTDARGKVQKRVVEYREGKGVLELAGKKLAVTPKVTVSFGKTEGIYRGPGKVGPRADAIGLNAWLTLRAGDLGLRALAPDTEIDVRLGMSGIAPPPGDRKP